MQVTISKSTPIKAGPARPLRSVSTLAPDPTYMLRRDDLKRGALYFYNNLLSARKAQWGWASLVMQALYPEQPQTELSPKDAVKRFAPFLKTLSEAFTKSGAKAVTAIRRDVENGYFVARVPILAMNASGGVPNDWAKLSPLFSDKDATVPTPTTNYQNLQRVDLTTLKPIGNLNAKDVQALRECNAGLYFVNVGQYQLVVLEIVFTKPQVEHLTNGAFAQARSLDFYGIIRSWVDGYYGTIRKSSQFSIPLPRIAASLPETQSSRLSEDGLCIDEHGYLYWLANPQGHNQVSRYQSLASDAYEQEDGSFSAINWSTGKLKTPPKAMPVLVDWTNLKFAYTSTDGSLLIKNLDRVNPVTIPIAVRYLRGPISRQQQTAFISSTFNLASFLNLDAKGYDNEKFTLELLKFAKVRDAAQTPEEIKLVDIFEYARQANEDFTPEFNAPSPGCLVFIRLVAEIRKVIEADPSNAFAFYSVLTICGYMADAIVFGKYGAEFGKYSEQDKDLRKAYLNQNVDPSWKLESVPFINEKLGLLPHQYKVQNSLRHSPNLAILPVDAGGGKTPLAIYEILKEMKTKGEDGLSLVFCPSHLVAQYVKEFSYFCGSRVNIIPVTSYTIRRTGYDALEAMIRHAPPNSVVISDYNAIVFRKFSIAYGTTPIVVYPAVEFLRKFGFRYVIADESHWLKNAGHRNASVARLFAEIPYKRLASGTFVANVLTDLVKQLSLLDASLFGSTDDFVQEYALETRGGKVLSWKPGAEARIKSLLREYVVVAEAKRKEWAAILPSAREKFHRVSLSDKQFEVYNAILTQIIEEIQEKIKENETLAALFSDDLNPDDLEVSLDELLKPYLARLEMFLNAPGLDPLGKELLTGDDLVSPKARDIVEICQEHLSSGFPGKILIFTNYANSRDAILDAFPPELRAQTIRYLASEKDECGAQFDKDDSKRIMIGIENSMNTGLNLQQASRLIRCETVWTPGALEQGNSRLNRPNIKNPENREEIVFDWLIVDRTIDVTKISYLMAKTISKAKFDEAGSPRFDALMVPPLFNINLETIQESNDFDTTLVDYFESYRNYKKAIEGEYAEYREKNKDVLFTPDGKIKFALLERAENTPGAAMMRRVPYVPGTELYKSSELGLIRYDDFMNLDLSVDDDEEVEEVEGNDDSAQLAEERSKLVGMWAHTQWGDGEIVRVNNATIVVQLPSGEKVKLRKLAAFVITRKLTSNKDIRTQLLKLTGDVPLDTPVEVLEPKQALPTGKGKAPAIEKQEDEKAGPVSLDLEITIVNDFLGIRLANNDDEAAVNIATANGFRYSPAYYAVQIKRPRMMVEIFKKWGESGFVWDKSNNEACHAAWAHWKANVQTGTNFYGVAFEQDFKNFYRMEFKPNADKTHINPYPLIQDELLYLALPAVGQPGSKLAIRKSMTLPAVKWMEYEANTELIAFVARKEKALALIESLQKQGFEIPNLKELIRDIRRLRIARD
jgi:hypothetical protein